MSEPAILIEDLSKRFGEVQALNGLSLSVPYGTVLGLLGPNGSGKTTAVRILATLLRPDAGLARVGGYDVRRQSSQVRQVIGLTGQYAAIDGFLTGRENLELVGRLYGLSRRDAGQRTEDLLSRFDLTAAAGREARTYSGGMTRRLDIAASLMGRPRILFLDEPTTGLDPLSRQAMWAIIRALVDDGATLLLTTQYLDEVDHLADQIAVLQDGRVIAQGAPAELKTQIGGQILEIRLDQDADADTAAALLRPLFGQEVRCVRDDEGLRITAPVGSDAHRVGEALIGLSEAGLHVTGIHLNQPSLEEVFLTLTGAPPGSEPADPR